MDALAFLGFVFGFTAFVMAVHAHRRLDKLVESVTINTCRLDAHRQGLGKLATNPTGGGAA